MAVVAQVGTLFARTTTGAARPTVIEQGCKIEFVFFETPFDIVFLSSR